MAQIKGKTGNPNGRPKGAPNKVTYDLRKWVESLVNKNLSKMESDLNKLEPRERLIILERLMQFALPKLQSVNIEAQIQAEYEAIERLLNSAPDEVIEAITERLINLNQINKKRK